MAFFIPTAAAGNGLTLATFGRTGELMGFFYPRIDYAQNVREGMHGIKLIGRSEFRWCFEDCWRTTQAFEPASNVLVTKLSHVELDLTIELTDVVPPGERALLRRIVIAKSPEVGPVQFLHYFKLAVADVYTRNGVHLYREQRLVLQHMQDIAIAVGSSRPFFSRCGSYPAGGESDTKEMMRAGNFDSANQAIGRVDFAIGFEPTDETLTELCVVVAGGSEPASALANAERLTRLRFDEAVASATQRVRAELSDAGTCPVPELAEHFDRAVISLHDLYDEPQGTFIAAPEFDPGFELSGGYGYCWPRDAAICALTVERIGRPEMAKRFFEWAARTQLSSGHWYQRYWTDGSPGPSWCVHEDRIQLDQTCAILHAAGIFARRLGKGAESFVKRYAPVAEAATNAILDYIGDDYLHRPATDLWENSTGAFAYTQAGVIAALKEAEEVFGLKPSRTGPDMRARLKAKLFDVFWQADRGRWLRGISPEGVPDATLDSSAMGLIYPWAVLDLTDEGDFQMALMTLDGISSDLRSEVKGGGAILRFQNESYMGGGPGCVNTLWLALCRLLVARHAPTIEERKGQYERAMADISVALANTSPTGQLPELIPKILFDYWACPHAWASSLLIESALAAGPLSGQRVMAFDAERARVRRRAPSH